MSDPIASVQALPGFNGQTFNPVALIQAVNELYRQGFRKAVEILLHYCTLSDQDATTYNSDNALLVARVLFIPAKAGALPDLFLGRPDWNSPPNASVAPLFPLYLYKDLPLLLVSGYSRGGEGLPASDYIRACATACTLRLAALQPTDTPLTDVDSFLHSSIWRALGGDESHAAMVRLQALRAISNVHSVSLSGPPTPEIWQTYRQLAVIWDKAQDEYRAGTVAKSA